MTGFRRCREDGGPKHDRQDMAVGRASDEETMARKRAKNQMALSPTQTSPAVKYWRADDFVGKASMNELAGSWVRDEHGDDDKVTCLGAGGVLDAEATEKALDSLSRDMKRADASNFKFLTTRHKKSLRVKDGEWRMKVRFMARQPCGLKTSRTSYHQVRRTQLGRLTR